MSRKRSAVALLAAVTAAAVVLPTASGQPHRQAVLDAIEKAKNDFGDLPPNIIGRVRDALKDIGGEWYAMVWGNEIPSDCRNAGCFFDLRDDVSNAWFPIVRGESVYMLTIFKRGWFHRCPFPGGGQNWWFTYSSETFCEDAYKQQVTCNTHERCYLEWKCRDRQCDPREG